MSAPAVSAPLARVPNALTILRLALIPVFVALLVPAEGGESWAVRVAPVDEWLAVSRRQATAVREALVAAGL